MMSEVIKSNLDIIIILGHDPVISKVDRYLREAKSKFARMRRMVSISF